MAMYFVLRGFLRAHQVNLKILIVAKPVTLIGAQQLRNFLRALKVLLKVANFPFFTGRDVAAKLLRGCFCKLIKGFS
jgi:hypothetical protein